MAGVYDRSAVKVYVDGILKNTTPFDGEVWTRNSALCIGGTQRCLAAPFRGLIGEVQLFNRALTEAEIKGIYDAGGVEPGQP